MHAFWLVLTYDLLEDRRIDDVIIKTFFNSLLYKTNRFQVAVRLFSNRSQRTSKCGKNISDTLGCTSCATFLFLPHFDVTCDLLLNRRTATWNLFVNYVTAIYPCFRPFNCIHIWILIHHFDFFGLSLPTIDRKVHLHETNFQTRVLRWVPKCLIG